MAESLVPYPNDVNSPSEEDFPPSEPLGIKNPLLGATPLWHNTLMPKFLTPLGAKPLSVLDPSIFSPRDTSEASPLGQSFDTPFFAQPDTLAQFDSSASGSSVIGASGGTENVSNASHTERSADRQSSRPPIPELIQARFQARGTEIPAEGAYAQPHVIQAFADPQVAQTPAESELPRSDIEAPVGQESFISPQASLTKSSLESSLETTPVTRAAAVRGGVDSTLRSSTSEDIVQRTPASNSPTSSIAPELQSDVVAASTSEAGLPPVSSPFLQRSSAVPVTFQLANSQGTEGQLGEAFSDVVTSSIASESVQRRILATSDTTQPAFSGGDQQPVIQRYAPDDGDGPVLVPTAAADATRSAGAESAPMEAPLDRRGTDSVVFRHSDIPTPVVSLPSIPESSISESSTPDFIADTAVVQAQRDLNPASVSPAITVSSVNSGLMPAAQRSPEAPVELTMGLNSDGASAGSDQSALVSPGTAAASASLSETGMVVPVESSSSASSYASVQRQVDLPASRSAPISDPLLVQRQVDLPTQLEVPLPHPAPIQRQIDPSAPQDPIAAPLENTPIGLISRAVASEPVPVGQGVEGTQTSAISEPMQVQRTYDSEAHSPNVDDSEITVTPSTSFSPNPSTIGNTSPDLSLQHSDVPPIQAKAAFQTPDSVSRGAVVSAQGGTIGQRASSETSTLTEAGIPTAISSQVAEFPAGVESMSTPPGVQRRVAAMPSLSVSSQLDSGAPSVSLPIQPKFVAEAQVSQSDPIASPALTSLSDGADNSVAETSEVFQNAPSASVVVQPKFVAEAQVSQSDPIAPQPIASAPPISFMGDSSEPPVIQAQRDTTFAGESAESWNGNQEGVIPQTTASVTAELSTGNAGTMDVPVVQRRQAATFDAESLEAIVPSHDSSRVSESSVTRTNISRNIGAEGLVIQARQETALATADSSAPIASEVIASVRTSEGGPRIQSHPETETTSSSTESLGVQPSLVTPSVEGVTEPIVRTAAFTGTTESGVSTVESDRSSNPSLGSPALIPLDASLDAIPAPVLQAKNDDSAKLGDLSAGAPSPRSPEPGLFQSALNLLKPLTRLFQSTDRSPQSTSESVNLAQVDNQTEMKNTLSPSSSAAPAIQAKLSSDATVPRTTFSQEGTASSDPASSRTAASEPTLDPSVPPTSVPAVGDVPVIQTAIAQGSSATLSGESLAEVRGIVASSADRPTAIASTMAGSQPPSDLTSEAIPSHQTLSGQTFPASSQSFTLPDTTHLSPPMAPIQRTPLSPLGGNTGTSDGAVRNQTIADLGTSDLNPPQSSAPFSGVPLSGASDPVRKKARDFSPTSPMAELGHEATLIPVQLKADPSAPEVIPLNPVTPANGLIEMVVPEAVVPPNPAGQELLSTPVQRQVDTSIPQMMPMSSEVFPDEPTETDGRSAVDRTTSLDLGAERLADRAEQQPSMPVQRQVETVTSQATAFDPVVLPLSEPTDQGPIAETVVSNGASSASASQLGATDWGSLQTPVQRHDDESLSSITPATASASDLDSSGLRSSPQDISAIESLPIQRKVVGTEGAIDAMQASTIAPLPISATSEPIQRLTDRSPTSNPDSAIVADLPMQNQSGSFDGGGLNLHTDISPLETNPSNAPTATSGTPIQRRSARSEAIVPEVGESHNGSSQKLDTPAVVSLDAIAPVQLAQNPEIPHLAPTTSESGESQARESDRFPDVSSGVSRVQPSFLQRRSDGQLPISSPSLPLSEGQPPMEQIPGSADSVPLTSNVLESTLPVIQARLENAESRVPGLPIPSWEAIASPPSVAAPANSSTPGLETIAPSIPAPANSSTSGSEETTTPIANSVLQAFSDPTAGSQLPTVLENLSVLQPLTSSPSLTLSHLPLSTAGTPLIQARPLTTGRNTLPKFPLLEDTTDSPDLSRASIPTDASSDRVSPISFSSTSSPLIPITDLAPSTSPIQRRTSSPVASFSSLPDSWNSMDELLAVTPAMGQASTNGYDPLPLPKPDTSKSKLSGTAQNSTSSGVIQAFPDPNSSPIQRVDAETQTSDNPSEAEAAEEDLRNLEVLAREIYSLVRQKMEIERERGGAYYSGRMPW